MSAITNETQIEGSLMGFISTRVGEQPEIEPNFTANTATDASTIREIGKRVLPIATNGVIFETVDAVEPKDPMWRNIPA